MGKIAPVRRLLIVLVALALPLLAVACGSSSAEDTAPETVEGTLPQEEDTGGEAPPEGDATAGKEIFASTGCGGCHTLEAAGTNGTNGPNLDESGISYEEAFEQISNGGGGMPAYKDQLEEKQIADVASFVTESAGAR